MPDTPQPPSVGGAVGDAFNVGQVVGQAVQVAANPIGTIQQVGPAVPGAAATLTLNVLGAVGKSIWSAIFGALAALGPEIKAHIAELATAVVVALVMFG